MNPVISLFDGYHVESSIWIFCTDIKLSSNDTKHISDAIFSFLPEWTSHNHALEAKMVYLSDGVWIIAVNSDARQASGCAIDKLMKLISSLEQDFGIQLRQRLVIPLWRKDSNTFEIIPLKPFPTYVRADSLILNLGVSTLTELKQNGLISVSSSWLNKFLNVSV
jgi:hypothetical protein